MVLTVLTWLWHQAGGRAQYTADHVNIWADMVERNLSIPHRIACVTDIPQGIDHRVEIIAPPREFEAVRIPSWGEEKPQCLRRISMFRRDAAQIFGDRFVCMDLDCVISAPIEPMFTDDVDFRICAGTAKGRPYNGSMMMLRAGARAQVHEAFTPERAAEAGRQYLGSDQAWIGSILGPGEAKWTTSDGIEWHGHHAEQRRITFFPGDTKPWTLAEHGLDPTVTRFYRRTNAGRCLVLGYHDGLWADVAEALRAGSIEGVIASPEAAEHWPGPVTAIARDNDHAAHLARMYGFDDVAWCGVERRTGQ